MRVVADGDQEDVPSPATARTRYVYSVSAAAVSSVCSEVLPGTVATTSLCPPLGVRSISYAVSMADRSLQRSRTAVSDCVIARRLVGLAGPVRMQTSREGDELASEPIVRTR